jgi:hypothetical protein
VEESEDAEAGEFCGVEEGLALVLVEEAGDLGARG